LSLNGAKNNPKNSYKNHGGPAKGGGGLAQGQGLPIKYATGNKDNIFVTQVTQQGTAQLTCTSTGNIIKVEGHSEECTSVIMAEQSQSQQVIYRSLWTRRGIVAVDPQVSSSHDAFTCKFGQVNASCKCRLIWFQRELSGKMRNVRPRSCPEDVSAWPIPENVPFIYQHVSPRQSRLL